MTFDALHARRKPRAPTADAHGLHHGVAMQGVRLFAIAVALLPLLFWLSYGFYLLGRTTADALFLAR
jgi:hypothetical protein